MPKLSPPGSESFLTEILNQIHTEAPNLPIDAAVIEALLVSVVAGDKHLILRTAEEDIAALARLTTSVSNLHLTFHNIRVSNWSDRCIGL